MAEYRMLLRSRAEQDKDEDVELIQKIVEKVLVSPLFLEKLVSAVTDKLNICNNELKSCKNNIDSLDKRMLRIEEALDEQEQYSRRNNIRIYGVPEITHENTCEVFVNLCREKLKINITNSDIDCCHRLAGKEGTNKPIIVRFVRRDVKNKVFNDKRKLKGTRIVITEDLTRMRFLISTMVILFVSYTQQEVLRQFPQYANMEFHQARPDQHFPNIDQSSPFHMRVFENEIPNEINIRSPPFILQRDIRTHKNCGCDVVFNRIDLGNEYVPRFLTTASCKLENCIVGQCKPVDYEVTLLKKRKPGDIDSSSSLPLELSYSFVRILKNITIDCQCKYEIN
ncbi:l1 transposable element-related [Holotrichia oblita]|uniref:L1 transposable element-related n=2 Tax=Holotrichia oblita TaxID=644536 RepID=A0ACB9SVJ4_HOLOL|nr:l1 transposable element-related [Holotrichia oblita]KAI4458375.1 l1 transposable element-related [Holotrichia oblita]